MDVENRYASPMKAVIGHEERIDFLEKEYSTMWQEMLSRVQALEKWKADHEIRTQRTEVDVDMLWKAQERLGWEKHGD